ncbi:MAG: prepilin-type N-terminal cleavage/methylation domain-containing protein [Limnobacter sp.]|nr:prepilin-type N-terminal cleavage/methylation domain-containing protein [Limnobacter sp.]
MNRKSSQGFSLIELAIALAVLAILAGGTLKGREILLDAKIQSTVVEITSLETALTAFESRYAALPGDFSAASAAGLGNGGNANNRIDTDTEESSVWQHLARAGFMTGSFDGIVFEGGNCPASTCRTSPLGGTMLISSRIELVSAVQQQVVVTVGQAQSAKVMALLDRRLDDGKPYTGAFQLLKNSDELCAFETNFWNEQDNPDCLAAYVLR